MKEGNNENVVYKIITMVDDMCNEDSEDDDNENLPKSCRVLINLPLYAIDLE